MKTNMFATKERRKKVVIALAMVAVLLITGIMALFTDHEEATNVFTVGSIDIELTEPNWVEANATEIAPNQVIAKDPMITNVGKNDAYTFIKVDIPKQDGNPLFELLDKNGNSGVNDGWVLVETGETADTITYVYGYAADDAMTRVTPTNATENLFSSVKVADVEEFKTDSCDIIVTGYGIQADDIPTAPADVWPLIKDTYFPKYEMITSPASVSGGIDALFESDASADIFKEVRVDGTAIASTNYTKSGTSTTKITLNGSYTGTLSKEETHTIEIVSNDGFAKAGFEVLDPAILITGSNFVKKIPSSATSVIFTDTKAPDGAALTDVSEAQDGSIVAWLDEATYKVSTQKSGVKVYANPNSSYMFSGVKNTACKNLTNIDVTNLDTSQVTDMSYMLQRTGQNASTFSIGGLSSWDTSKVTNMSYMFNYAGYSASTWSIGDLSSWDTSSVTNMSCMFYSAGEENANTFALDLSGWDTSKVTNMSTMFRLAGLKASTWSIGDLSGWNTSRVTNMSEMFESAGSYASEWRIGDLSNWDTSQVTDMNSMFYNVGAHASTFALDLSGWDTSKVTNMSIMFRYAGQYASTSAIDLSGWDTSKVTDISWMFNCVGQHSDTVTIKGLSSWDTSKVINMSYMFGAAGQYASTFTIEDLSSWDTSSVTTMIYMFSNTGYSASGWSIDCSSWNVDKVTGYSSFNSNVESKVTAPTWVN